MKMGAADDTRVLNKSRVQLHAVDKTGAVEGAGWDRLEVATGTVTESVSVLRSRRRKCRVPYAGTGPSAIDENVKVLCP